MKNMQLAKRIKLKISGAIVFALFFSGISETFSQSSNVYKIQSLFLYNFTKHVKWANPDDTFIVGIYGNDKALAEIKENLKNKIVWGKKIKIVDISSADELSKCHIAYMPKSNKKKILEIVDASDLSNTLLVTEDDLVSDGAAISFVYQQNKMKFKISKTQIEQVGLKVSSSLVSIGIAV